LTDDAKAYAARPFVISGTCKREDIESQKKLLQVASSALQESQEGFSRRLYCIASDGDARRRRALAYLTLIRSVPPSSPIFSALSCLRLFNLLCGDDDRTPDFDWKHILKRFRNTLLRLKGIIIDDIVITAAVLKMHLMKNGMAETAANAILSPNDKQDVTLMIQLLNSLAQLPEASGEDDPSIRASRRIIRLLGILYRHLLEAYLDPTLSLHEQLTRLSAAAHITLALYFRDKGNFIPIQLYFDVMSMIKNIYFCVAKTQKDDPDGHFWIILLGTDGLEKVFGTVRTMVSNDTNADQLQLSNRIDGAVQCVRILEQHPDWGGESRRITVKSLEEQGNDISRKMDHINPKSWKGDTRVSHLILRSCWDEGRRLGERNLAEASMDNPFQMMEDGDGYDIMCPFGGNKMVLIHGTIAAGEEEETAEERDEVVPVGDDGVMEPPEAEQFEPDLDDLADADEVINADSAVAQHEAWLAVDNTSPQKRQHKSTILRFYSSPLTVAQSKDRLKRVRGFSQFDEDVRTLPDINASIEKSKMLSIEDPALTLVRCNNMVFLAVIKVLDIHIGSASEQTLSARLVHEPNVRLRGQIMCLTMTDTSHQPDAPDWEWNGLMEPGAAMSGLRDIEGSRIDLVDADLCPRTQGRDIGSSTYVFRSSDLRDLAAILYERLANDLHRLPTVSATDSFPYRSEKGIYWLRCSWNIFSPSYRCCMLCL
jgi:hypothetical protein